MKRILFSWLREKSLLLLSIAVVMITGMILFSVFSPKLSNAALFTDYLFKVEGYGVTEQEFQLFLYDERASTGNYYFQKYGADSCADFWDLEFDGQTPMEHARKNALEKLLKTKMKAIIAVERNLIDKDISFTTLMKNREAKNSERTDMLKEGQVFYGLSSFDEYQYYNYINDDIWRKLVKSYLESNSVGDDELQPFYRKNKEMFNMGVELKYMLLQQDGSTEIITGTEKDIPKDDTQTLSIWYELKKLKPGQQLNTEYKGKIADILLISKKESGYKPISEVRGFLLQLYAEDQLNSLVDNRVRNAKVDIDQNRFNSIHF